jgi:hypothetical protein
MSGLKGNTLVLAVMMATSLAGCTSLGLFQTPEERVQHRAQARLDALLARDIKKAFSFLTPAFRETTTWQRYSGKYAGVTQWRAVGVNSVECDVDRCDVNTFVTYQMVRPKVENTRSRQEVWINVDGQWYFYPR